MLKVLFFAVVIWGLTWLVIRKIKEILGFNAKGVGMRIILSEKQLSKIASGCLSPEDWG